MKKRLILITILVLIIIVGGVGIGLAWKTDYLDKWLPQVVKEWLGKTEKPEEGTEEDQPLDSAQDQPEADEEEAEEEPKPAKTSELKSLDKTWNKYTNSELGFSIKVPKKVVLLYTLQEGDELLSVKIFEDTDNNAVFISTEYYYPIGGGEKALNSLERLKDEPRVWTITMEDITSDSELDGFIEERYGLGCIGKKEPAEQEGVYDVEIQDGTGKGWVAGGCPVNYGTVVKYFPAKNKVFFWDLGNAGAIFVSSVQSPETATEYDDEMIDSFKFLE